MTSGPLTVVEILIHEHVFHGRFKRAHESRARYKKWSNDDVEPWTTNKRRSFGGFGSSRRGGERNVPVGETETRNQGGRHAARDCDENSRIPCSVYTRNDAS